MNAVIPQGADPRRTMNILLVEDDEVDAGVISRRLEKGKIANALYRAECGADALEMLRREDIPRPCVTLLDINMPRMNGVEFLKALREDRALKESIVFVLTTSARQEDKSNAYGLNVAGYFLKDNLDPLMDMLNLYWRLNEFPETGGGHAR